MHRILFVIEFIVALVLLIASSVVTLFLAGMLIDGQGVHLLVFSFLLCSVCSVLAVFILGTAAFAHLSVLSDNTWKIASIVMLVCLISLSIALLGPSGDTWDPIKIPAFGSILIVPFVHCWYYQKRAAPQ